jgi:GT2 family glycosyltransferase
MPVHVREAAEELVEADFVSGCAMMLRRRLVEEIGAFDTRYFMYGEDIDLCARARKAGYRVVAVPSAQMWHRVSISADKVSAKARYWRTLNQILVYRRHPHGPLARLLPAYVLIKALADMAQDVMRGQSALVGPTWRGVRDGLQAPVGQEL